MQDALNEFHGTAKEIRISIANADHNSGVDVDSRQLAF